MELSILFKTTEKTFLTQRSGALNDTAKAIDLNEINTVVNVKLLKQLKKELNEILRFSKSKLLFVF
jgi:hypothetical protein